MVPHALLGTLLVADIISPSTKSRQCTHFEGRSRYFWLVMCLKYFKMNYLLSLKKIQRRNIRIYRRNASIGEIWYLARLGVLTSYGVSTDLPPSWSLNGHSHRWLCNALRGPWNVQPRLDFIHLVTAPRHLQRFKNNISAKNFECGNTCS